MRDDALPITRILCVGGAIAIAVALAIVVVLSMLAHRRVSPGGLPVARPDPLGADVAQLQAAPQEDLAAYRAEKSRQLEQPGWVDVASGVAHVPVDVAMALLVARAASGPAALPRPDAAASGSAR